MDKLEIAKAKELRGDIIERLYGLYGSKVSLGTLRNMLRYKSYFTESDVKKAIEYLSGAKKEFIEVNSDESEYWASMVQLTPLGVNLAERDITDMGVVTDE